MIELMNTYMFLFVYTVTPDPNISDTTDHPAPAPTSRAVEVKGGGDDKQGWEDRGRGTVGAYGTS